MTLVVEDGTGLETAEAYISVADADTYIAKYYGAEADWDTATDAQKEAALRRGARYIDGAYNFKGTIYSSDQALSWPRDAVYDERGYEVTGVPDKVAYANAEAALRIIQGTSIDPDIAVGGQVKLSRVKADVVEQETEYFSGASPLPRFPIITRLLKSFIIAGTKLIRA